MTHLKLPLIVALMLASSLAAAQPKRAPKALCALWFAEPIEAKAGEGFPPGSLLFYGEAG